MDLHTKMSVMYVILIAPMTVLRTVLVHGVALQQMISVESVVVITVPVQMTVVYQMATTALVQMTVAYQMAITALVQTVPMYQMVIMY